MNIIKKRATNQIDGCYCVVVCLLLNLVLVLRTLFIVMIQEIVDRSYFLVANGSGCIGLYRENAIAIESEARYPFGGNEYYVTMQITFPIPEFARQERNMHCDVVHVTTKWVSRLALDHAIAAIQTSR